MGHQGWEELKRVLGLVVQRMDHSDEWVWETHGGRQNFTYGRLMSWWPSTLASGSQGHGRPADTTGGADLRDRVIDQDGLSKG